MLRVTRSIFPCIALLTLRCATDVAAEPRHFMNALATMRAAGIRKVIFGENHDDPHKIDLTVLTLLGFVKKSPAGEVTFQFNASHPCAASVKDAR
jgi:hypothetical protein